MRYEVKSPEEEAREHAIDLALVAYILENAAPFFGKTKLQKTTFLVELNLRERGLTGPRFCFYRYKKGPFSKTLLEAHEALMARGLVRQYTLTDRGVRLVRFVDMLKQEPDNRAFFEIADSILADCQKQHGAQLMDDLYELHVRPEGSSDKMGLKDIPMGTDIVVPRGEPSLKIPAEIFQAIVDELEITDEEVKQAEKEWPEIEARALRRLQAAISDD